MNITKEELNVLVDAAEQLGGEVRTDYSGRGMYGGRCVGVDVGSGTSVARLCMRLAVILSEEGQDELIELMCRDVQQDSMGRGSIVYFPCVQAPERT